MITSMREHRGHLYLGGIIEQPHRQLQARRCRPGLRPVRPALGEERMIGGAEGVRRPAARPRRAPTITVPVFDGALKPNQILEKAETVAELEAPEDLASDGKVLYVADGRCDPPLRRRATPPKRGASTARSPRCAACRTAASPSRSTASEVQVFASPSAATPRASFADPAMNAVNALSPGPKGRCSPPTARRTRPPAMVPRPDGPRPQRARAGLDIARRQRPHHRGQDAVTRSGRAPRATTILVSESWRHRLVRDHADGRHEAVLDKLPVYPSRMSPAAAAASGSLRSPRAPSWSSSCCAKTPTAGA